MTKLYHYIFSEKSLHLILKDNALKPANITMNDIDKYKKRVSTNNENDYFIKTYNYFYKDVVKENYRNYGIYLTTIDLFKFNNNAEIRFNIPYENLTGKTVVQIYKNVSLVNGIEDIEKVAKQFEDVNNVEKLYNGNKLPFKHLPQIVNFSDYISINKNYLEYRNNFVRKNNV